MIGCQCRRRLWTTCWEEPWWTKLPLHQEAGHCTCCTLFYSHSHTEQKHAVWMIIYVLCLHTTVYSSFFQQPIHWISIHALWLNECITGIKCKLLPKAAPGHYQHLLFTAICLIFSKLKHRDTIVRSMQHCIKYINLCTWVIKAFPGTEEPQMVPIKRY